MKIKVSVFALLLAVSPFVSAVDYGKLAGSVDMKKAGEALGY